MKPIVHGLEAEYWGSVDFVYLNHEDSITNDVKREYGFRWRPYFVFVEPNGTVIQTWFGSVEADEFRAVFDAYLAQNPVN